MVVIHLLALECLICHYNHMFKNQYAKFRCLYECFMLKKWGCVKDKTNIQFGKTIWIWQIKKSIMNKN
jgi:hypothetical protein